MWRHLAEASFLCLGTEQIERFYESSQIYCVRSNFIILNPHYEAESFAAGKATPRMEQNLKLYCCFFCHKTQSLLHALSQSNPFQLLSYLINIHFNIILTSMFRASK